VIEITSPHTKLYPGDCFILKGMDLVDKKLEQIYIKIVGRLNHYDPDRSLSGLFEEGWRLYKISGNVQEIKSPFVIAWYLDRFLLLSDGIMNFKPLTDIKSSKRRGIKLYKLNDKEKEDFLGYVSKKKLLEKLK